MVKKKIANTLGRNFRKSRENDKISVTKRSEIMAKIKSKGTKFETDFINYLKQSTKTRFKTNVKLIKGKPDIVFGKHKVCVFLDSDFWHGWQFPRWRHLLKNDFWIEKIENNRKRDKKISRYLKQEGWTVVRIWEHKIKRSKKKAIFQVIKVVGE